VYVVRADVTVGVPVIAPVDVLRDKPAGKSLSIEKVYGATPEAAVTGMKEEEA
jgi:hypothetical protein